MNIDIVFIFLIFSVWFVLPVIVVLGTRYYRRRLEREAGTLLIECGRSIVGMRVMILCGLWLGWPLLIFPFQPYIASIFFGGSVLQVMFLLAPYGLFRTQLHEDAVVYSGPMIEGRSVPWRNVGTLEWIGPGHFRRGLSVQLT